MLRVEDILTRYVDLFPEVSGAKEKANQAEIVTRIGEINEIIDAPVFGMLAMCSSRSTSILKVTKSIKAFKAMQLHQEFPTSHDHLLYVHE